uniref:Uncharacterized protein n=1 Tax=Romanomermis culicivorax TaxID=13658 RepID=A0A915L3C3_ROMCU
MEENKVYQNGSSRAKMLVCLRLILFTGFLRRNHDYAPSDKVQPRSGSSDSGLNQPRSGSALISKFYRSLAAVQFAHPYEGSCANVKYSVRLTFYLHYHRLRFHYCVGFYLSAGSFAARFSTVALGLLLGQRHVCNIKTLNLSEKK